jgi:uncharacterized paraquat-inducible protein A
MSTEIRCPECRSATVSEAGEDRRRCPQCGASLRYRPQWLPLLVTAIALSSLLGVGSALLFDGKAPFLIVPLTVPFLILLSKRFRKLQKV